MNDKDDSGSVSVEEAMQILYLRFGKGLLDSVGSCPSKIGMRMKQMYIYIWSPSFAIPLPGYADLCTPCLLHGPTCSNWKKFSALLTQTARKTFL